MKKRIEKIEEKIIELQPLVESQFITALNKIKECGYKPKLAIVLPNKVIPEGINNIFGIFIEHRILRTPDGKLIEILFEVE